MKQIVCVFASIIPVLLATYASAQSVVTSPMGGEQFVCGSTRTISWNPKLVSGMLTVSLWDGGHGKWLPVFQNVPSEEGSIQWQVPEYLEGSKFRIKISTTGRMKGSALSRTFFSIVPPPPKAEMAVAGITAPIEMTVHPNPASQRTRICVADLPANVPATVEVVNIGGDGEIWKGQNFAIHVDENSMSKDGQKICNPGDYELASENPDIEWQLWDTYITENHCNLWYKNQTWDYWLAHANSSWDGGLTCNTQDVCGPQDVPAYREFQMDGSNCCSQNQGVVMINCPHCGNSVRPSAGVEYLLTDRETSVDEGIKPGSNEHDWQTKFYGQASLDDEFDTIQSALNNDLSAPRYGSGYDEIGNILNGDYGGIDVDTYGSNGQSQGLLVIHHKYASFPRPAAHPSTDWWGAGSSYTRSKDGFNLTITLQ